MNDYLEKLLELLDDPNPLDNKARINRIRDLTSTNLEIILDKVDKPRLAKYYRRWFGE